MALFAFAVGLTLRREQQILEFRRHLENRQIQFEDPLSGAIYTWEIEKIYREINSGELNIVRANSPKENEVANSTSNVNTTPLLLSLESLPARRKDELERKLDYVNSARKQGLTKGRRKLISGLIEKVAKRREENPPSASAVMDWWRKLDLHDFNLGVLVSGNFHRKRAKKLPDEVIALIRKILRSEYFTRDRNPLGRAHLLINRTLKISTDHDDAKRISLSTVRRVANEVSPYFKDVARFGPAFARNKWRYSLQGSEATRVLQRVEVDHTQLDLVVICDRSGLPLGRPTITVIIDSYSGYVISFFVSFWGPGLGPTLNAMKIAIMPKDSYCNGAGLSNPWLGYGLFELAVVDNGLEFHSPQFKLAAWHMDADIQYCAVRQPWLKPSIERVLGTVGRSLPAVGRVYKPLNNYLPPDPKKTAAITFSQLCSGLLKTFVDVIPFEASNRSLVEPFELFQESFDRLPPPLLPSSLSDFDLIAAMSKQLTVGNEGVVFDYLRYNSVELQQQRRVIAHTYKTVIKFSPENLDFIYVQDPVRKTWLTVPSCQPSYTRQLSYIQHRAIRTHLKGQLKERNTLERLERGKLELIDMYDGYRRGNQGKKNIKAAQQFGTLTSAQTLAPNDQTSNATSIERQFVTQSDLIYQPREIPSFSSFQLD